MNRPDRIRQQRSHGQLHDLLVISGARRQGDGIQHHDLLQHGIGNILVGVLREQSMRGEREHSARSVLLQLIGGLAERSGSIDHVIDDNAVRVLDGAHEIHRLDESGLRSLLDDHRHARVHAVLRH